MGGEKKWQVQQVHQALHLALQVAGAAAERRKKEDNAKKLKNLVFQRVFLRDFLNPFFSFFSMFLV
ncbi:MAG: hypothetical protein HYW50_01850 [Candidatus Diapherotrites archaeon]|nr:hypothetical protein [Candidatus Diapherotrites archaeon]